MSYYTRKRKRGPNTYTGPRPVKRVRSTTTTVSPAYRRTYYGRTKGYYRKVGNYGRFQGSGGTEYKVFDQSFSGTLDSTGEVLQNGGAVSTGLNIGIAQGTSESQRIGTKICVKSVYIRLSLTLADDSASDSYRFALVLDKQANGAYPTYSDVYSPSGGGAPAQYLFPINISNTERFIVLKEWFGDIVNQTHDGTAYGVVSKSSKKYLKVDLPIDYNGPNGSVTEVRSNNLILVGASRLDDKTTYQITTRLRYSDK